MAVSGATAVVGAAQNDDAGPTSGSAYIFDLSASGWVETKITASDAEAGDAFGYSVAVSGDTVLVGAKYDDDVAFGAGAAYVFDRRPSGWVETAKLTASDGAASDHFGWSVSVSGDRALVGARDVNGLTGAAYIFDRTPSGWVETAKLTASDGAPWDMFGYRVSLSGDTALVGAPRDDAACPSQATCDSGSAYVFELVGSAWVQTAKLTASDAATHDWFGASVSLSGDSALIGAPCDGDAGPCSGSVYYFERSSTGTWGPNETEKLTASDAAAHDKFGVSVSISGGVALIGAHLDDDAGDSSGSAYIFELTPPGWIETAKLVASDGAASDLFGLSVSLSGDTLLVGARGGDDACPSNPFCNSGSAYVYAIPERLGQSYCGPAVPNSSGRPAAVYACGSDEIADNYFVLFGTDLPAGQFGYFLTSQTQGFFMPPGSSGFICLGGNIGRYNGNVGQGPSFSLQIDLTSIPVNPPVAVQPGDTWNFQAWYRDAGGTTNFTDAVAVTFQ